MGGAVADLKARRLLRVHFRRPEFKQSFHLAPAAWPQSQETQHPEIPALPETADALPPFMHVLAHPKRLSDG